MNEYNYVRAKVDVYSHRGNIVCFAGKYYPITFIDYENRQYIVECEPEKGIYETAITVSPNDPEFYFLDAMIEDVIEEVIEEIIEDEIYDDDDYYNDGYYDDGDDW